MLHFSKLDCHFKNLATNRLLFNLTVNFMKGDILYPNKTNVWLRSKKRHSEHAIRIHQKLFMYCDTYPHTLSFSTVIVINQHPPSKTWRQGRAAWYRVFCYNERGNVWCSRWSAPPPTWTWGAPQSHTCHLGGRFWLVCCCLPFWKWKWRHFTLIWSNLNHAIECFKGIGMQCICWRKGKAAILTVHFHNYVTGAMKDIIIF